jgi:hypothetical protein
VAQQHTPLGEPLGPRRSDVTEPSVVCIDDRSVRPRATAGPSTRQKAGKARWAGASRTTSMRPASNPSMVSNSVGPVGVSRSEEIRPDPGTSGAGVEDDQQQQREQEGRYRRACDQGATDGRSPAACCQQAEGLAEDDGQRQRRRKLHRCRQERGDIGSDRPAGMQRHREVAPHRRLRN